MTTNGSIDLDDDHAVAHAVRRLRIIASELSGVRDRSDELYAERMRIVYQLRGVVPQQQLAEACGCGVDMVKNIVAHARRKFDDDAATV